MPSTTAEEKRAGTIATSARKGAAPRQPWWPPPLKLVKKGAAPRQPWWPPPLKLVKESVIEHKKDVMVAGLKYWEFKVKIKTYANSPGDIAWKEWREAMRRLREQEIILERLVEKWLTIDECVHD